MTTMSIQVIKITARCDVCETDAEMIAMPLTLVTKIDRLNVSR